MPKAFPERFRRDVIAIARKGDDVAASDRGRSAADLLEGGGECVEGDRYVLDTERQRRANFQDLVVSSDSSDEHAVDAHGIDDGFGGGPVWFTGLRVDELHAHERQQRIDTAHLQSATD